MGLAELELNPFVSFYYLEVYLWPFTLLTLATEIIIIAQFLKGMKWWQVSAIVFVANILSSIVGFQVTSLVPTGRSQGELLQGYELLDRWNPMICLAIAFVASVTVETALLASALTSYSPWSMLKSVTLANIASYSMVLAVVLIVIASN